MRRRRSGSASGPERRSSPRDWKSKAKGSSRTDLKARRCSAPAEAPRTGREQRRDHREHQQACLRSHRAAGEPGRAVEGGGEEVAGEGLAVVAGVGAAEDREGEEVPA